jgi:hypothetical protein
MIPNDPRHGTSNGYINLGCRCAACRRAHTVAQRHFYQNRRARLAGTDVEHGSASTYFNWGCRCRPCTDSAVEQQRLLRQRRRAPA